MCSPVEDIGNLILEELKGMRNDLRQEIGALRFQIAEQFRALNGQGPIEAPTGNSNAYKEKRYKFNTSKRKKATNKDKMSKNTETNDDIGTMVISSYQSLAGNEVKYFDTEENTLTEINPVQVKTESEEFQMNELQTKTSSNFEEYGNEVCSLPGGGDNAAQGGNNEREIADLNYSIPVNSTAFNVENNIPEYATSFNQASDIGVGNNFQLEKTSVNSESHPPDTIVVINGPVGTQFDQNDQLGRRVDGENMTFDCKQCNRTFNDIVELRFHLNTHLNDDRFICTNCKMEFPTVHHLNYHINSTHVNVHRCGTCGRNFRTAEKLKRHIRVHTNERPYICSVCDKQYKRSDHLAQHKKSIEHMKMKSRKERLEKITTLSIQNTSNDLTNHSKRDHEVD